MEQYITEFMAKDIDGVQLLQMNGSRLKVRMKVLQVSVSRRTDLCSLSAGSGRAQFIRPQHAETTHQRPTGGGHEGEKSSGQTGEEEGKAAKETPGAAAKLRLGVGGRCESEGGWKSRVG